MSESLRPRHSRIFGALFCALLALHLLPLWLFDFFPSQDGPSHVANALILKSYAASDLYQRYFDVSYAPIPNWFSHASLAALMHLAPPFVAEKILLSGYALALPLSMLYLVSAVHPGRPLACLLAFVFLGHFPLHMGFYNFSFGLALYPLCVGYWWKHREEMSAGRLAALNLLLVLVYFCHLIALGLALATILLLALATATRQNLRARSYAVLGLVPAALLPAWFFVQGGTEGPVTRWAFADLYRFLAGIGPLVSYERQSWLPRLVMAAMIAQLIFVLAGRWHALGGDGDRPRRSAGTEPGDAFFVVLLALLGLYFLVPDALAGGAYVTPRLGLFPFLMLLVVMPLDPGRPLAWCFAGLALVLIAAQWHLNFRYYRVLNADLAEYTSGRHAVAPGKTFMALTFDRTGSLPGNRVGVMQHAAGYYAAVSGGVDLGNYEADTGHFPVHFRPHLRPGRDRPPAWLLAVAPHRIDVYRYCRLADYILAWKMPASAPSARRVQDAYREVYHSESGRLQVFERIPQRCPAAGATTGRERLPAARAAGGIALAGAGRWKAGARGPAPANSAGVAGSPRYRPPVPPGSAGIPAT